MNIKTLQMLPGLNRRRFVQGLAAGGVLSAMPPWLLAGYDRLGSMAAAPILRGPEIDLVIAEQAVNFTGVPRMATTINGSIPAPTLYLREGDEVTIRVTNTLSESSSIHWHGILLPFEMDGVPGVSFNGIAPGETFVYRFTLRQSGTYWYHSHSGFQEMTGMYGALIIEPASPEPHVVQQDHVVLLSDWTDEDPMNVFRKLKVQSDLYNVNQPTFMELYQDVKAIGFRAALEKRSMWNQMRMNPTDLADLSAATLTFLMNGTTPAGNWTGLYNPGDKLRLRFINGASNTFYDVRIPGLRLTVVQADGQNTKPVEVDEFRFGPGETYDVLVEPKAEAYTIFAQTMDRSGYARGTLAVKRGLSAEVPALDPVEWLSMADMMGSMSHDAHQAGSKHAMHHNMQSALDKKGSAVHHRHDMHAHHGRPAQQETAAPQKIETPHDMHGHHGMHDMTKMHSDSSSASHSQSLLTKPSSTVRHARTEYGPSVDMRVDMPRTSLDDPGTGLRDLVERGLRKPGHRVLTLADLRSAEGVLDDKRPPVRELELHLTGNMERYSWSFDGLEFGQSTPVFMRHEERIRIILQNDTMMTHPMHLHGMWSELETDQGELLVRRHTIPVQPAQRISFLTTPNDLGRWVWHCHLLFHMDAGMFREVVVA